MKSRNALSHYGVDTQLEIMDKFCRIVQLCIITDCHFAYTPEGFEIYEFDLNVDFKSDGETAVLQLTEIEDKLFKFYEMQTGNDLRDIQKFTFDPVMKQIYPGETGFTNNIYKPNSN